MTKTARIAMPWLSAAKCESPIEEIMLTALDPIIPSAELRQQVAIGPYRVDFLIGKEIGFPSVVVECDGRRFHDATGEQNQRDRIRDRYFQRMGLAVLRFSGTEIKARAISCAMEVSDTYDMRTGRGGAT